MIFVPNGDPYRKRTLKGTPAETRLEMVKAAIADKPGMEVTDVEVKDTVTAVRTPITMRELYDENPDSQLAPTTHADA